MVIAAKPMWMLIREISSHAKHIQTEPHPNIHSNDINHDVMVAQDIKMITNFQSNRTEMAFLNLTCNHRYVEAS